MLQPDDLFRSTRADCAARRKGIARTHHASMTVHEFTGQILGRCTRRRRSPNSVAKAPISEVIVQVVLPRQRGCVMRAENVTLPVAIKTIIDTSPAAMLEGVEGEQGNHAETD